MKTVLFYQATALEGCSVLVCVNWLSLNSNVICFPRWQSYDSLYHQVLIYPAMDSRTVPDGDSTWDERNLIYNNTFGLSYDAGYTMCVWYFPDNESVCTPLGSPVVEENFEHFPPTRFFTVEYDTLRIATKVTFEKMKVMISFMFNFQKAGVDVKYKMVKGGVHAIWGSKKYDCGLNDLVLAEL